MSKTKMKYRILKDFPDLELEAGGTMEIIECNPFFNATLKSLETAGIIELITEETEVSDEYTN